MTFLKGENNTKKTLSVIFSLLIVLSAFSGLTVTAGAETDLREGLLDLADTGAEADLADTGDASVNNRDAMILDRYVAGWDGYNAKIVNRDAADLNRDASVNNRDAMILDRYVAGWPEYDKYFITIG